MRMRSPAHLLYGETIYGIKDRQMSTHHMHQSCARWLWVLKLTLKVITVYSSPRKV